MQKFKKMNAVITNPISNIPKLKNSHVHGWSQIWSEQLQAPIDHACSPAISGADVCYIEHGVNFGGSLNLFGGATKELFDRINRVAAHPNLISLDIPMPDWGEQLSKRLNAKTTYSGISSDWCSRISARLKNVKTLQQQQLPNFKPGFFTGITVGDSHSPAYSSARDIVLRTNGRTLFGALKDGLINEFRGCTPFGDVTFCYGNIDIRHHLLRHKDFDLKGFIQEYVKQAFQIRDDFNCNVYFAAPLPIEYEGRKLPKSGYYKGTPFYGSRDERAQLMNQFGNELKNQAGEQSVVHPPYNWYGLDPEKFAKVYMEHGSSVHLSPEYYRRKDWGETCLA